jgi:hypothetical protein
MGFKDLFRRKKGLEGQEPSRAPGPPDKAKTLEALLSIACSIKNGTFRAARPFLAARHGVARLISPFTLYYEADSLFLAACKLARELGDKAKEAAVLYHWAHLQYRPPQKGIMFAPHHLSGTAELIRTSAEKAAEELKSARNEPVPSNPELALGFFLEAIPLAEETGQDVFAAASLLYSAQIYKARGDMARYSAQTERLRQKITKAAQAEKPLPPWLLDEIKAEVGP